MNKKSAFTNLLDNNAAGPRLARRAFLTASTGLAVAPAFAQELPKHAAPNMARSSSGGLHMFQPDNLQAVLTTVASFPRHYFLENLVVRHDNSILVTAFNKGELWYVPPIGDTLPVEPLLVHKFPDQPPLNLIETEPDLFYIHTSNIWTTHDSALHRLDLRGWSPGEPVRPQRVLDFPIPSGLNGSCLLAPNVILVADSVGGLIWRVDLAKDGMSATTRVWLAHEDMASDPNPIMADQPGINGIRYARKTGFVYYTSTTQRFFMRVRVHPETYAPDGAVQFVSGGRMADDFCIDEEAGIAYLTTHIQNTIDVVSLAPEQNSDVAHHAIAGNPFSDELIGPSSGAWGRRPGEYGRIGYFTTDGGTKRPPPDGVVRPAKLVRLEINSVPT